MVGTITNIIIGKRCGFVRGDDGIDRFFHSSMVARGVIFELLREGHVVEIEEATPSDRGRRCRVLEVRS